MNSFKIFKDKDCLNSNIEFDFNPINYPLETLKEESCILNLDDILITQI